MVIAHPGHSFVVWGWKTEIETESRDRDEMNARDIQEIAYMPALELRERFRRRDLSPIEVTGVILERIGQLNPSLNAYLTVTVERALEDARLAERRYMGDGEPGELCGIPISIKDLTPTRGIRTTMGSLLYENHVPDEDGLFVERVNAAGAVMLGKTNTPEFGWKGDSGNRLIGPTHNPWKHGQTAGGSSGGAAAAVAAGLGPLAQGSDGAGSVRIPAGFCGIFGLKPTLGLIAYYPPSAVDVLSHLGPMTRTVRDAALLMNVVARQDDRDRLSYPIDVDFVAACDGGISGLRVAWSPDLGYAAIDPEVRETTTRAAERLSDLGCHVEEVNPGIPDPWEEILDPIWLAAQAGRHKDNFDAVRDLIDPGRVPLVERGMRLSAVDVVAALAKRHDYYHAWRRFMVDGSWDLLVTPQLPVTAFTAGESDPGVIAGRPVSYLSWTAFSYPFNITGQPAATVPCGFASDGLPVALQFVGRWRDDATVLRAAAAYEEMAPWAPYRPPVD
jgi:aspartyl-tRNA(Asn)/glutamyl-tRNA(Gln) amidotransferase subunit A